MFILFGPQAKLVSEQDPKENIWDQNYGNREWRGLYNEELCVLSSAPNIIKYS